VNLSAGQHTIRLQATADGWNINWFKLFATAQVIPGRVEAESYSTMYGIQTETCSEGGQDVGYIDANDWMDYTVNVASTGTYTVNYRVALNTGETGGVNFIVDGVSQKTTSLPSTGGWQKWVTVSDTVTLSASVHTIRLKATAKGWNINWFELK
jgi:hypothetical protein